MTGKDHLHAWMDELERLMEKRDCGCKDASVPVPLHGGLSLLWEEGSNLVVVSAAIWTLSNLVWLKLAARVCHSKLPCWCQWWQSWQSCRQMILAMQTSTKSITMLMSPSSCYLSGPNHAQHPHNVIMMLWTIIGFSSCPIITSTILLLLLKKIWQHFTAQHGRRELTIGILILGPLNNLYGRRKALCSCRASPPLDLPHRQKPPVLF